MKILKYTLGLLFLLTIIWGSRLTTKYTSFHFPKPSIHIVDFKNILVLNLSFNQPI